MTKKEFINTYNLNTEHKIWFMDGTKSVQRMLYRDPLNNAFVFFNNDLHTVICWEDRRGNKRYRLGAGYSWYR